ncbi:ATP-binding protein [Siminovitchia fortis]|uniref:ATP-binding protein n=1 Tax=Siminovitchia fortis TaxID=254758 RepID=UPI00119D9A54|nr:ATP-binding protein [Siminovitchia fortis]
MFSINKFTVKNTNTIALILTAVLTALASEIKVTPFGGEAFRFGLGSIAFFLLILIWPPASLIRTGFVTGIVVICFRIAEDIFLFEVFDWTSIKSHLPAFLYYFIFALGLHVIKVERYKTTPLILGAWAVLFEFVGNGVEQLTRHWMQGQVNLDLQTWALLGGVAIIRSYFVVGLYSSITVSEQRKRMQEMLEVGSELYAESLYLEKSMNHIERITASSHDLYRHLKKKELHQLSAQALHIAQEIHEVKKDSQRVLSGITKITERKRNHILLLSDVLNIIVSANKKYSELLKKNINFRVNSAVDFETDQQMPLLALLNNLTANSVEAITNKGEIHIKLFEESAYTCFVIKDSGKGIPKEYASTIFETGYTTKYSDQGVAATGIGLSHVKEIIQALEGKIELEFPEKGAVFRILIPTKNIRKRVE